jgi:hypothetical protein
MRSLALLALPLAFSLAGCASDTTAPAAPPPPQGLFAEALQHQVLLHWTASSTAQSYNVYRSDSATVTPRASERIASIPNSYPDSGQIVYADSALVTGTTYRYLVTAVSVAGESAPSVQVVAGPVGPPALQITSAAPPSGTAAQLYRPSVPTGAVCDYGLTPCTSCAAYYPGCHGVPSCPTLNSLQRCVKTVMLPGTFRFKATGGIGAYTWSATGLPPGLVLGPGDGSLTGTPTAAGSFVVDVLVTDGATPQDRVISSYTMSIAP